MRVFVSSTVYDLIDIRAEIAELLRSLGISPVLSDDKLSDFILKHDASSIEACLVNVESSDAVIIVLDKRYGPSLKSAGFDDLSATHLEYRHAVKLGKPIHFYVRDRLEADAALWKKNGRREDVSLSWIDEKNVRLFEILEEHRQLTSDSTKSNWYSAFNNSVDLKKSIQQRFETAIRPQQLMEAIYENRFPLFNVSQKVEQDGPATRLQFMMTCLVENVTNASAFNFSCRWGDDSEEECLSLAIMSPRQHVTMAFGFGFRKGSSSYNRELILEYYSNLGIMVEDIFSIGMKLLNPVTSFVGTSALLKSRTFKPSTKPLFELNEI